jgi:hypothetical protein
MMMIRTMNRTAALICPCLVFVTALPAFQNTPNAASWKTTEAAGNKAAREAHFGEAEKLLTANLELAETLAGGPHIPWPISAFIWQMWGFDFFCFRFPSFLP